MKPTSRDKRKGMPNRKMLVVAALALLLACFSGVAWAASWKSGNWKGRGKADNVCIEFKVKGSKVRGLQVKGLADGCAHRYVCPFVPAYEGQPRAYRSAPGGSAKNIKIRKNGSFVYSRKRVIQPPFPGPGARRIGMKVTGKLKGSKATGTFRTYFLQDGAKNGNCDSGTLKWKATVRRKR